MLNCKFYQFAVLFSNLYTETLQQAPHLPDKWSSILEGGDLDDTAVNAAQALLSDQCGTNLGGFQNTLLGQRLNFKEEDPQQNSVQILHTG